MHAWTTLKHNAIIINHYFFITTTRDHIGLRAKERGEREDPQNELEEKKHQ